MRTVSLPTATLLVLLSSLSSGLPEACAEDQADDTVYLFTTFRGNGEEGLRFAYSLDGYQWKNVPGHFMKPDVGRNKRLRDPSILRGPDGTFHLVWTTDWKGDQGFGYASSKDLAHWSKQRFIPVMEHEPTTVNVWAPELFYDRHKERFIICWASCIPGRFPDYLEDHENNHRMYYSTTKDFQTFEPAKLFLDPGFSVIDCTIVERGDDDYVLVLKDNTRPERDLKIAFGRDPLGPWSEPSPPFTKKLIEGPTVLKLGDDWVIYYDSYGDGTYGAVKTPDFRTFTDISAEVSLPEGHKHGTIVQITRLELEHLLRAGEDSASDDTLP